MAAPNTGSGPADTLIDYEGLGKRLRAYRIGASLQAEDVAEKLGVSRAVVYRLEKGEIVKLDTSVASLLGVEVEYYSSALGLFERMRQLEESSERILSHFEPISVLLTSPAYLPYLREMLLEAAPRQEGRLDRQRVADIDAMLAIMEERKRLFQKRQPHIVSLIGLRELERFLQTGLVGRVDLPEAVRTERVRAARGEVERIASIMESEPINVQIGLIDDAMPSSTFQVFSGPGQSVVAISPFRLGELPNVRNGIATVTESPEAVRKYREMMERLWSTALKGRDGAGHLRRLLARVAPG
jgi:transcriptional regulator with XRE-family HTH domain